MRKAILWAQRCRAEGRGQYRAAAPSEYEPECSDKFCDDTSTSHDAYDRSNTVREPIPDRKLREEVEGWW